MALLPWKRVVAKSAPQTSTFEELAFPLLQSLYNVAEWLTRNPADAEDLVQETFLKALRGFATFEPGTNFKAWIFRILRNSYLTSRSGLAVRRTVALEDELEARDDPGPRLIPEAVIDRQTPEVNLMRLGDKAALQAAMEKLAAPLLEMILLCDVEEMKYREIATVLEIPIGTVMSRIARARRALREMLQAHVTLPKDSKPGGEQLSDHLSSATLNALADGELCRGRSSACERASRSVPSVHVERFGAKPSKVRHRQGRAAIRAFAGPAGATGAPCRTGSGISAHQALRNRRHKPGMGFAAYSLAGGSCECTGLRGPVRRVAHHATEGGGVVRGRWFGDRALRSAYCDTRRECSARGSVVRPAHCEAAWFPGQAPLHQLQPAAEPAGEVRRSTGANLTLLR